MGAGCSHCSAYPCSPTSFIYRNSPQLSFHGRVSPVRCAEALGRTGILCPLSSLGLLWPSVSTPMCHAMLLPTILPPPTAQTTQEKNFNFRSIAGSVKQHFSPPCQPCSFYHVDRWKLPSSAYFSTSTPLAPGFPTPSHISPMSQVRHKLPSHSRDISDLPAQHPSDSYMDSTWAFPLTSTAAGFIPLFLMASVFPHGLLFYLGAHDCIWQGLLIVSTDFTRDWF